MGKSSNNQPWRQLVHVGVRRVYDVKFSRYSTASSSQNDEETAVYINLSYSSESDHTKSVELISTGRTRIATFNESFDFYSRNDEKRLADINVELYDYFTSKRIGSALIEISSLAIEQTHRIKQGFVEGTGTVEMTVTLTGTREDLLAEPGTSLVPTWNPLGPPIFPQKLLEQAEPALLQELKQIFNIQKTFDMRGNYCGLLVLKVMQGQNLIAADPNGKSDPFCVIEIVNVYLRTQTVYKTLNPTWNRVFYIPIYDISSLLRITVFDEDRGKAPDFLGRLAIPLLELENCPPHWFALKTSHLAKTTSRGYVELEAHLVYNKVRAALRAFTPKEVPFETPQPKISVKRLQRDIRRLKQFDFGAQTKAAVKLVKDCLNWTDPMRSVVALMCWVIGVYFFELWMAPLGLGFLLLVTNYLSQTGCLTNGQNGSPNDSGEEADEAEDDDPKMSLKEKLAKIQETVLFAQKTMEDIVSTLERLRNIVFWKSPWLAMVAAFSLFVISIVLYTLPLRWLVMALGVSKLTKRKFDPLAPIGNFEPYDLVSRAISDLDMARYSEVPIDTRRLSEKAKRREDRRSKHEGEHDKAETARSVPADLG